MAHYGSLGTQPLPDDVDDLRGTIVRGAEGQTLGKIDDVIFGHDTMRIYYIVVDSRGWLRDETYLIPADRVSADPDHPDGLSARLTKQQVEESPAYDDGVWHSSDEWKSYEREFNKYWEENPVMHMKGSDRTITPMEGPDKGIPVSSAEAGAAEEAINPAELFPERISEVFSDPAPGSSKITLRPDSVAHTDEVRQGVPLERTRWWESFESYLQVHKKDIQSRCSQCSRESEQRRVA